MKPGSRARVQLCDMRRELIGRLDRAVTGDNLALLASVQSAIVAIDAAGDHSGEADGRTLMPISNRAYREIWENLSEPGYEHVTAGENREIHLGRVRLIRR